LGKNPAKRPIGRRLVALAAAYAIALSSLIASFGAASAAATVAGGQGGILCHSVATGEPTPAGDETNNKICTADCCVGCLMLMAAVPPPPAQSVAILRAVSQIFGPSPAIVLAGGPQTKSHQSRAPPLSA
jgi:hypothetical protein